MAKVKAKTKAKAKRPQKTSDPIAVSLKLLAHADKESVQALRHLFKAIMERPRLPAFAECKFGYAGKRYKARLTVDHCEKILEAIQKGDDLLAVVSGILAGMTGQVAVDIDGLEAKMGGPAPSKKGHTGTLPLLKIVVLGCCTISGGNAIPNLTQSQCNQYNPINWDSGNPNCSPHGGE